MEFLLKNRRRTTGYNWSTILWGLFFLVLVGSQACNAPRETDQALRYNVLEEGLQPDGKTLNTSALQNLIDRCAKKGGGTIFFPKGVYLSGTIYPKSNLTFELAEGAVLLGSDKIEHYTQHFLFCRDISNFKIAGKGKIDGQGAAFWTKNFMPLERPIGWIFFKNSRDIVIEGITLQNSPSHVLVLESCQDVKINQITVLNDKRSPNTDGIDITNSRAIYISHCRFSTGDDAICLKSKNKWVEDIKVENCEIESDDAGLKFGTGSAIGVRNCLFKNISIKNTRYGIALFMKDGGIYENNRFEDITIRTSSRHKTDYPIFIDIDRRFPESKLGAIQSIFFRNIAITTRGNLLISGHPEKKIKHLSFENIKLTVVNPVALSNLKKPKGNKEHQSHEGSADYASVEADWTFANIERLLLKDIFIQKETKNNIRKDFFFEHITELEHQKLAKATLN